MNPMLGLAKTKLARTEVLNEHIECKEKNSQTFCNNEPVRLFLQNISNDIFFTLQMQNIS